MESEIADPGALAFYGQCFLFLIEWTHVTSSPPQSKNILLLKFSCYRAML